MQEQMGEESQNKEEINEELVSQKRTEKDSERELREKDIEDGITLVAGDLPRSIHGYNESLVKKHMEEARELKGIRRLRPSIVQYTIILSLFFYLLLFGVSVQIFDYRIPLSNKEYSEQLFYFYITALIILEIVPTILTIALIADSCQDGFKTVNLNLATSDT